MEKVETFNLDGLAVEIKFAFDKTANMYIGEYPDFEENPIYSPNGRPIVTAARDSCPHNTSEGKFADCGSCKFFKTEGKDDLIGFCTNEALRKKS